MARENHTSMKLLHSVVCIALCVVLVLVSGCTDTSFGTLKPSDFGTSAEEIKALDYYKQMYGEPGQPGDRRFLEPTLTTALDSRNLPVDSITSLSADAPKVYFWVFYDRFAKGDPMTITWTYLDNNKVVLTETKSAGGVYGRVFAEFVKPSGGWPAGKHQITITGKGASVSKTFDVVGGQTVTDAQPFTPGSFQTTGDDKGGSKPGGYDLKPTSKGAAAGTSGSAVPPPGSCSCPSGRSGGAWDGIWHHKNWGDNMEGSVSMCQDGSSVTATYNLNDVQGRLSGTVSGNRLTGTWAELDSSGEVALTGRMILVMAADGNTWGGWFSYDPNAVDTTGPYTWTGDQKAACGGSLMGTIRTVQTMTVPPLRTAVTTMTLPVGTAKTTTSVPWQTASTTVTTTTTTPAGGTCGGHCNDPNRQCGLWDARWYHKNWGDNLEGRMTLCQNGNTVTGTYNLGQTQGSILGTTTGVSGTQLSGTWREYDPDGSVNSEGAFIFRLKSGNRAWDGWFNYNPGTAVDTSNAATWTGTKL
jgi:hypothetical protein